MQINNKKALAALAAFLEATSNDKPLTENDRKIMVSLIVPCVNEEYNFGGWFMRGEIFFRGIKMEDTYLHKYNGAAMAKLLKYIVKHEKFPRNGSLSYNELQMKLSTLDKVFSQMCVAAYGDNLNKINVVQIMALRRAFYAGAKVMVEAANAEPPLTDKEGQELLDNISEFGSHIKEEDHNRMMAAAILTQAQMKINGASTN